MDEQPEITLIRWRILEVAEGECKGQRYLVGYCPGNCEGRVSTAIVSINVEKKRCTTQSGRIYHLEGRPGYDPDGGYVWRTWTGEVATIDVSSLIWEKKIDPNP